jgi:hypothetical protein
MPHTNINLSRAALASLFSVFRPNPDGVEPRPGSPLGPISNPAVIGRPPDDGGEISPRSPWGPIIRRAFLPLLAPGEPIPWKTHHGDAISINPQPLPPRWQSIAVLAKAVSDHLESGIIFVGGMDAAQKEKALGHAKNLVSRMIDDCGNGKFFPWKPKGGGPILPDGGDPGWGADIMVFALALEQEAGAVSDANLRSLLGEAAGILLQRGADQLNA